ncbi:MAG: hypothetical protein U9N85_02695 [Bacteroidota bacterium]|nr:hypothetical protein [Bacteroidota bacterium]
MKKELLIIAVGALLFMSSCATMTSVSSKKQAPKFTTIDKVVKLSADMTYRDVVQTLGSIPYDLHTINYDDEQTIYVWHYKLIERKEDPGVLETKEGSVSGDEVLDKQQKVYVTFDNDKNLVKAVTDAGIGKKTIGNTGKTETVTTEKTVPFWQFWKKK